VSRIAVFMRRFSIALRMRGAVALVMGLFALVGVAGLGGGAWLKALNTEFMEHSVKEVTQIAAVSQSLATMRLLESQMVLAYEDNNRDLDKRLAAWGTMAGSIDAGLKALLEGDEDDDNAHARKALELLAAYRKTAVDVFAGMKDNRHDTALAANEALAPGAKQAEQIQAELERIVKNLIAEISVAASEQSGGIGQVNSSVAQLDQSTQQNAALVEQSAAAAESLREQAPRLNAVVATFRLA
jgi:uncharacterized phage infection (PIP) family protein YhgE